MSAKRPIDIQRNAAITLRVGGDDESAATDFLSTGNSLYVIKEKGVHKIQLANDIDPGRTKPEHSQSQSADSDGRKQERDRR